jgi:hypothetical protein
MPDPLSIAINNASERPVIQTGAARIGVLNAVWPFLPVTSNLLNDNALTFVESLYGRTSLNAVELDELADYLALSSFCHSFEGWRYLAQSAISLLMGARDQAIHLAYYAELRAALSLLASSGVGILNSQHYAITATGQVGWFSRPTHKATWAALREWANARPNGIRVIDCFQACGLSSETWAKACSIAPSLDEIGSQWLKDWGIDLERMSEDSLLRNEASYRPNLHPTAFEKVNEADLNFLNDVCESVSMEGGQFENIDIMVIHDLCVKACELKYGDTNPTCLQQIWGDIINWIALHEPTLNSTGIVDIVRNATTLSSGRIMQWADPTKRNVQGVISRALLLLRLAEALKKKDCEQMRLLNSAIGWQSVMVHAYGLCANLWDGTNPISDYMILDEDRKDAQKKLEDWISANTTFSPHKMWKEIPDALFNLCRFERVGVMASTL